MVWAGHVAQMRDRKGAYRVFVGRPDWRRPLGRCRHRWEDNINMDFQVSGMVRHGQNWSGWG